MTEEPPVSDVVIIGAGMAGACAAFALSQAGVGVAIVDTTESQAPVFRAEKIEPDQVTLLRSIGLMDLILPRCRRISRIACGQDGRIWKFTDIEEYGCFYHDMVNAVRHAIPVSVRSHLGRAVQVRTSPDVQEVFLADGTRLKSRLLVIAAGTSGKLAEQLGMARRMISPDHSLAIGFNIASIRPFPNDAESLTYREKPYRTGIDYLTIFPITDILRVNLFAYWTSKDPRVQRLREHCTEELAQMMPKMARLTGSLECTSKIEMMPIHLYRMENTEQAGVVLLGDVYQSVCPVTGTGLTKVLTDVKALAALVPDWLRTPGMNADKIARFYATPNKRSSDESSLSHALYDKQLCSSGSIPWRLRRGKKFFPRWLAGIRGVKAVLP